MKIVFAPFEPNGQQYIITGAERDVFAVLVARGVAASIAKTRISAARQQAAKTGERQYVEGLPPRERRPDTDTVEAFIRDSYLVDPAGRVLFATFYSAFLASLPPVDRQVWSRKRVAAALPPEHATFAGAGNRKYVRGIADEP